MMLTPMREEAPKVNPFHQGMGLASDEHLSSITI